MENIKGTLNNSGQYRKNLSSQFVNPDGSLVGPEPHKVWDFYKANKIAEGTIPEGLKQLEHRLTAKIRKEIQYFERCIHPHWIQAIKDYTLSTMDRKVELCKKGKNFMTNEKQPIVRTYVDRIVASILRSKMTNKIYASVRSCKQNVETVQHAIEWAYSSSDLKQAIKDAGFDAILLGPGFWETDFNAPVDFMKINSDEEIDEAEDGKAIEVHEVGAIARRIDPFCIYGDPSVDFYHQPITYRDWFSLEQARLRYKKYFELNEEQIRFILGSPQPISKINHKRVRLIKYEEQRSLTALLAGGLINQSKMYEVKVSNDAIEVCEYSDGANLVVMFNGYIVYDGLTQSPTRKHRIKVINYTNLPGTWVSDSVGTMLAGPQRLYDAMYNIMFDLAKFSSGPMFLTQPGVQISNIDANGNVVRDPFKMVTINGPQGASVDTRQMPTPDNVNFKMMADVLDMSNFAISPSSYNQVPTQSRSATDAELRQMSLTDPVLSLSESVGKAIAMSNEEYILFMKQQLPEKISVGLFCSDDDPTSEERAKRVFKTISRDKLAGNFIFESEYEAVQQANKAIERQMFNEFIVLASRMPEDSLLKRVIFDMEALGRYANELYNNRSDFVLSDKEFEKKSMRAVQAQGNLEKSLEALIAKNPELAKFTGLGQSQFGGQGGDPNQQGRGQGGPPPSGPPIPANVAAEVANGGGVDARAVLETTG